MAMINNNNSRRRPNNRIPRTLLIILILGLIGEAVYVYKIHSINQAILNPAGIEITDDSSAHEIFAKAWYVDQQGDYQAALQLYNTIESNRNTALAEKVKYNMGTIYLKQAAKHWNAKGVWAYTEVTALRSFAEQSLTEVVKLNNKNWDARYNLEYALRIKPPPKVVEKADWTGRRSSVHAIYPGIPGGGP